MDPPGFVLALTYRRQLEMADVSEWCYVPGECVTADPIVPLALILLTGLVTFLVAAALVHIDDAFSLLDEERDRTRAERAAFADFARRIGSLEPSTARAEAGLVGAVPALDDNPPDSGIRRVKDAYRDTVMSVSHYEEEYDEPLEANLTAELGPDVAAAISDGSALTPHLKSALAGTSAEAVSKREDLLRQLDREATALADAEERLSDVETELDRLERSPADERSFDRLVDAWSALSDLEDRCRSVLTDRQEFVHRCERRSDDAPSLQSYLYRPLDVDYPVLADGTALMERIQRSQKAFENALAGRS